MATYAACFAAMRRIMNTTAYRGVDVRIIRDPIIGSEGGVSYPAAGDFFLQIMDRRSNRMGAPASPQDPSWETIRTTWNRWDDSTEMDQEHYRRYAQMRGIHWSKTDETQDRGWRIYDVGTGRENEGASITGVAKTFASSSFKMSAAGGSGGTTITNEFTASMWLGPMGALGTSQLCVLTSATQGFRILEVSPGEVVNTMLFSGFNFAINPPAGSRADLTNPWPQHLYVAKQGTTVDVLVNGVAVPGYGAIVGSNWNWSTLTTAEFCLLHPDEYMAEFWLDDSYWDPSIYLSKFYNAGKGVDLGVDGSLATGTQPIVYYGRDQTAADWIAGSNLGSGNSYVPTGGTLSDTANTLEIGTDDFLIPDVNTVYP